MSSNARQPRGYTQDYIARIRYSNALPPPSMPPKLQYIPASDVTQYLTPAYAARLAREQPINIEADSELGMPLNLVGMPGVFDGDESSIQAPEQTPAPHPGDAALLRPFSALGSGKGKVKGKGKGKEQSAQPPAAFLRRTEHLTSEQKSAREAKAMKANSRYAPIKPKALDRPQPTGGDINNQAHILKTIIKGFDIANPDSAYTGPITDDNVGGYAPTPAELQAWNDPQHPTRKDLKVVNSFPVLPDPQGPPDSGGYLLLKFLSNPGATVEGYDERVSSGLLKPLEARSALKAAHDALAEAHKANPSKPAPAPIPASYEFYIPYPRDEDLSREENHPQETARLLEKIKRKYDLNDPERDDDDLYYSYYRDQDNEIYIKSLGYKSVRAYESTSATSVEYVRFEEVALTLYDPDAVIETDLEAAGLASPRAKKRKAAYLYPLVQRSNIRPRRNNVPSGMMGGAPRDDSEDADLAYRMEVWVRDPNEAELVKRFQFQVEDDPSLTMDGFKAKYRPYGVKVAEKEDVAS
ncbi:MAG: hypothetical protein M1816_007818 [Peltula sp. TS41687]|nr:MAG: hypothetical protein M1816_007818 [Peltula sp. TS41687]